MWKSRIDSGKHSKIYETDRFHAPKYFCLYPYLVVVVRCGISVFEIVDAQTPQHRPKFNIFRPTLQGLLIREPKNNTTQTGSLVTPWITPATTKNFEIKRLLCEFFWGKMDTNFVILLISSPFDFARWHLLSTFYFGPILGHLLANFDARLSDEKFTVLFQNPTYC